jgi:hypothetical protein
MPRAWRRFQFGTLGGTDKRGVRRYEHEIPAAEKSTWNYLTNEPCSKLEAEVPQ